MSESDVRFRQDDLEGLANIAAAALMPLAAIGESGPWRRTAAGRPTTAARRAPTLSVCAATVKRRSAPPVQAHHRPRYRDTEIPRYRDTEIPRYRDTEIPRYRDTEIPRYRTVLSDLCPEVHRHDYLPCRTMSRGAPRRQWPGRRFAGHRRLRYKPLRNDSSRSSGRYRPGLPCGGVVLSRTACFIARSASR